MSDAPGTPPPPPVGYDPPSQTSNGLAVASLVLGLIAVVLMCVWYVAMPCAVLAIIFGALGRGKANREGASGKGMATAGLVLGIIGVLLPILVLVGLLAALGIGASEFGPEFQQAVEQGLRDAQNAPSGNP